MKRKKIISYLLLGLVLLPLLFTSGLQAFQQYVKYTVTNRLESKELVTISIPVNEVEWMEEGREIRVVGRMFDIKSYNEKDGYLVAEGVYDDEETAVVELLNHFGEKEQTGILVRLLVLAQAFVAVLQFYPAIHTFSLILKHNSFYDPVTLNIFSSPPFHPPRLFSH